MLRRNSYANVYATEVHRSIRTPLKFVKAKNSFQISVLKHPL